VILAMHNQGSGMHVPQCFAIVMAPSHAEIHCLNHPAAIVYGGILCHFLRPTGCNKKVLTDPAIHSGQLLLGPCEDGPESEIVLQEFVVLRLLALGKPPANFLEE